MGNAKRDDNFVPTLIGVSNADNITPVAILADPATGRLLVNTTGTVTATVSANALGTTVTDQVQITASAQQGPSNTLTNGVIVSALSTNTGNVFVGSDNTVDTTADGTGDGYILEPGASVSFAIADTDELWFIGTLNDVVSLAGS